jgi:GGDEF domain-containing protein
MSSFEVRELEFASDGVQDSLTLSMAPALFHENLKREISTAMRESRKLTMVSLVLEMKSFQSIAEYQTTLIEIAHLLKMSLRAGDFFARISDQGFWILLRIDIEGAHLVIDRLELPRKESLRVNFLAREYLNYSEWVERLDLLHFN